MHRGRNGRFDGRPFRRFNHSGGLCSDCQFGGCNRCRVSHENTASGAALADADNAQIGPVVQSVAFAALQNQGATSVTAGDYLALAKQIYAASKQALTKLA